MADESLAKSTIKFLSKNILEIIFFVILLSTFIIFIIINNITFKKPKTKVNKVIIVEKLTNPPPEQNLRKNASTGLRNNKICKKLDTKEGCTSLGTCVWVTGTEKSSKISRCIAANDVIKGMVPGSDGPIDKCFKNKEGKFLPWEEFYYLDGDKINKGKGISSCS